METEYKLAHLAAGVTYPELYKTKIEADPSLHPRLLLVNFYGATLHIFELEN